MTNFNSTKIGFMKFRFSFIRILDNSLFLFKKIAGRIVYPIELIRYYKVYVSSKSYYPDCKLKSKFQIFLDQFFYIIRTGEINRNYFLFGFDRKSKNDFKNYVPRFTFQHKRDCLNRKPINYEHNPFNYICLTRDKFVFEAFCRGLGINTPKNICLINSCKMFLKDSQKFLPVDDIITLELDAFCKMTGGYGGKDVFKLKIKNQEIFINNNKESITKLKRIIGKNIWIIQENINNQIYDYAQFHPSSLNTIRVITVKFGLEIVVLWAFFRMGVNNSFVDNFTSGGIVCPINILNGTLGEFGISKPESAGKTVRHPNSGIVYKGFKLPYWENIIEYVKNAHHLFYGLHSIGWDVAVTTNGIILIEANENWDPSGAEETKGAIQELQKYFK